MTVRPFPSNSGGPRNDNKGMSLTPHQTAPVDLVDLSVNTVRTLAMDAVQRAGSGHAGTAMALAPVAYTLWMRHMRYDPGRPDWFGRDRFVLSAGHSAILQYSMLHLTGYPLPLDEIKNFRRTGSLTPGHPENFVTQGVETTTGPLGQGAANSVGMAMAEAHLAAVFNRPGHEIVDHRTYAICSDGDLMEGVGHETASLAGHLKLGKLTWLWDDNRITIDGTTQIAFTEDVEARFRALGWHTQRVEDANDIDALDAALQRAGDRPDAPSLIAVRSHIGYGAPNKQDTPSAHGAPLGEDEIRLAKASYGWPTDDSFLVPDEVRAHMGGQVERGRSLSAAWDRQMASYESAHPDLAREFGRRLAGELPEDWDKELPVFDAGSALPTRVASGKSLVPLARRLPELIGGSADLAGSNNSNVESPDFQAASPEGRNIRWGVREHAMASAANGMALHGGVRPYVATFFIFSDYARPAMRLAAMMKLPVIYVLTHDSIGLGADGPTHQPVEHLASFRAMPGMTLVRPGDANETAEAWRQAAQRTDGPTVLVLSRQALPVGDPESAREAVKRGAGVVVAESGETPDVVIVGSGSEVQLARAAAEELAREGVAARAVSFPSWEVFRRQPAAYRESVFPPSVPVVAIEAGAALGWSEWTGPCGSVVSLERFGRSGASQDNFRDLGITSDRAKAAALRAVRACSDGCCGGGK